MPRNRGQGRKAAAYRRRYDNRSSEVHVRYRDGKEAQSQPLDEHALGRTVVAGNHQADPRPRTNRRTWSPPGD